MPLAGDCRAYVRRTVQPAGHEDCRPLHLCLWRRRSDGGDPHEVLRCRTLTGQTDLLYSDHNGISIDGETEGWFTDDTAKRFEAYHWHVVHDIDGHDPEAVKSHSGSLSVKDKTFATHLPDGIGFGSPNKAGKEGVARRGAGRRRGVALTRQKLDGIIRRLRSQKKFTARGCREKARKRSSSGRKSLLL